MLDEDAFDNPFEDSNGGLPSEEESNLGGLLCQSSGSESPADESVHGGEQGDDDEDSDGMFFLIW